MYTRGQNRENSQVEEKEMDRYQLHIIGLINVNWSKNGKTTMQSGKVMLYSEREDRLHQEDVGAMLPIKARKCLVEWKLINERLMYFRLYTSTLKISLIVVYSIMIDSHELFMKQLQEVINSTSKHVILIVMGNFNARVGSNNQGYGNVMCKHVVGKRNENEDLVITMPNQQLHKPRHKNLWILPDGICKTENQIDHMLISEQH